MIGSKRILLLLKYFNDCTGFLPIEVKSKLTKRILDKEVFTEMSFFVVSFVFELKSELKHSFSFKSNLSSRKEYETLTPSRT